MKAPSYFTVRNQKTKDALMTSLHTKPPELFASPISAFSCKISIWILQKTFLFLSLTICQDSIIFCGLRIETPFNLVINKDISLTSLN